MRVKCNHKQNAMMQSWKVYSAARSTKVVAVETLLGQRWDISSFNNMAKSSVLFGSRMFSVGTVVHSRRASLAPILHTETCLILFRTYALTFLKICLHDMLFFMCMFFFMLLICCQVRCFGDFPHLNDVDVDVVFGQLCFNQKHL